MKEIPIKDEYIKLDQFLKFVNLVSSGIEAKMIIKDGQVKVNGEVELRRGKKLHDGDQVEFEGNFDFRNYNYFFIEFDQGINILIGGNAQGKTNIIEAIYLLSVCKSFRTHINDQMIRFDHDFAKVKGNVFSNERMHQLELILSKESKKAKVDGKDILKISDYVGYLNAVVFVPDDLSLVKGSPSIRRKFLDLELSKISPIYVFYLTKYNRLLKERNQYLKLLNQRRGKYDEYLETLDEQLAEVQIKIIEKRNNFIERLSLKVKDIYLNIANCHEIVELRYECFIKDVNKEDILKLYQKGIERDLRYLSTYYGIHKEDMKIFIDNKSAHQFASQGQQRTIVLSMKIALIELIKEEIGEYPILLLDDVLSELDDQRKTKLLDILNNRIQTFITTTSIDGIEHHVIKEAKKININHREEK